MADEEAKRRGSITRGRSSMMVKSMKSLSRMRMRKQSFGFSGVPGIRPVERTSQLAIEFKRPPLVYLNTYQLEPERLFHVPSVTRLVNEMLDESFVNHKYNAQDSPSLVMRLTGDIMRRLKTMDFPRYRFIVVATIAQKRSQSYNNAIIFLWDHERDDYVDVQRESVTAAIQITVFGVYLD